MKPETLTMIKSILTLDGTVSQAEITIILEACKNPTARLDATPAPATGAAPTANLTLKQTAKLMTVSLRTVQRCISAGELPSIKFRGNRRVSRTAIDAFMKGRAETASSETLSTGLHTQHTGSLQNKVRAKR